MPQVEFHTGVAEPLVFACRLLRKAYRQGARVAVSAPRERLLELDRLLWTFDERDFVPHLRVAGAAAALLARTPIWLVDAALPETGAPPVLVNLGAAAPEPWPALARLIEIVGAHPAEAEPGRERWRHYRALGWPVVHHAGQVPS
jgi:DNA polymerase III subunit chi